MADTIIIFDGLCRLCHGSLRFVERRDRARALRYAPFQSAAGALVVERFDLDTAALDSFIVLADGEVFSKSAAWAKILRTLRPPWSAFGAVLAAIPAGLSDPVYDFVGRRRHCWFGRFEQCPWPLPDDELAASVEAIAAALPTRR